MAPRGGVPARLDGPLSDSATASISWSLASASRVSASSRLLKSGCGDAAAGAAGEDGERGGHGAGDALLMLPAAPCPSCVMGESSGDGRTRPATKSAAIRDINAAKLSASAPISLSSSLSRCSAPPACG